MHKSLVSLAVLATLVATPALAGSISAPMTVQATVLSSCSIGGAAGILPLLNFGNITDLSANVDAEAANSTNALIVNCSNGLAYSVSAGAGSNETGGQRRMAGSSGTDYLPYDLYADAGRTQLVATSGAASTFATLTGAGTERVLPLYGRVPAGTTMPAAGSYSDTVMLTVTY